MQQPPDSNNLTPLNSGNRPSQFQPGLRRSTPLPSSNQNVAQPPRSQFPMPHNNQASKPLVQRESTPPVNQASKLLVQRESTPPVSSVRENHSQVNSDDRIHLRTSRRQKFLMVLALVLTAGVAIAAPLYVIREVLPSHNTLPGQSHVSSTDTQASQATPTPMPGPLGTAVLPSDGKILTGMYMSGKLDDVSKFGQASGKHASILLMYQGWGSKDGSQYFPSAWASSIRSQGAIPLITWEPWVEKEYPQGNNEPDYALKNIISGKFDSYIKSWATAAKAWKGPFFLRFAPEMNGNWTPWSESENGNQAGEFVRAWRHIHAIFKDVGTTNATWVWCPNITYQGATPLSEFYPGDAYVDWTAMDGFNWGSARANSTWQSFSQVFKLTYKDILKLSKKPIMVAETASIEQGGNKADWITQTYSVELPEQFPNIRAIVWFNQQTQEDWRINSSAASLAAFTAAMRSSLYTSNTFAKYTGG